MAPNPKNDVTLEESKQRFEKLVAPQASPWNYELAYLNLSIIFYFHIAGLYGLYLCFTEAKWSTIFLTGLMTHSEGGHENFAMEQDRPAVIEFVGFVLITIFIHEIAIIGTTAGARRLWSHRTYKAKLPLQIILVILQTTACQSSVIHWARDHRLHHKYSDTDGDPHNATRGFFFSHIGWLFVKKHPEAKNRMRTVDLSDLFNNPLLKFQYKYAFPIIVTLCFILPTIIPMYFWGETFNSAWHISFLRVIISHHITFLVNSAAHTFGNKPYDQFITPTQSISVSLATLGEGYHNYHHVFPWDYRAAELGNTSLNFTTMFINFFAWIGWAYELKTVSNKVITRRAGRTGDGTNLWGWGDKDLPKEHKELVKILCPKDE